MNWSIIYLESFSATGIVISAQWKCSDEQVARTGTSIFPEPSDLPIAYDQLTEQDVLNWVWTDGGVDKTLVEESVTKELESIINPIVIKNPLPWNK
jgi:hypothetical protein